MYVCMVSAVVNIGMNCNWLGSSTALYWHGLKSWKHPYFRKMPVFPDGITTGQWLVHLSKGDLLREWMCYLKMWRSLVFCEEAHFQIGKRVYNICQKPLEVRVSLVSLQKLPCLHSSHSALVTICEQHFEADFSKPGSACTFQTILPAPQLSRICCYFKIWYVLRKSPPQLCRLAQSLIICIFFLKCLQWYLVSLVTCKTVRDGCNLSYTLNFHPCIYWHWGLFLTVNS